MVVHVAVFRWRDGVDPDARARLLGAALDRLAAHVPGLTSIECGGDLRLWPRTFDFALVARFTAHDALLGYQRNPAHQEVFGDTIEPVLEAQGSVQFDP